MRVLHISEKMESKCGGSVCIQRNLEVLRKYYGQDRVVLLELYRKKHGKLNAFFTDVSQLSFYGLNAETKNKILHIIKLEKIGMVFLDTSTIGILAKIIKKKYPQIKVITFFHNIEYFFFLEQFKLTRNIKYLHKILLSLINEKCGCTYSDKVIVLNQRDENMMLKKYHRKADAQISISLFDEEFDYKDDIKGNYILFIGSNFPPNTIGISFFIEKVLPYISYKLVVAGTGMEILKEKYNGIPNLEIHGFVEDLSSLYADAQFVVLPIFSGSGMKIKTAEALKYGKYIIAAPEALTGYTYTKDIAVCCENAEHFIIEINNYDPLKPAFNKNARNLFLEKYSNDIIYSEFSELFQKI